MYLSKKLFPTHRADIRKADTLGIEIEGEPIHFEDINLSYYLLTQGARPPEESELPDQEIAKLRGELIENLVERKILYKFIAKDRSFDINNPARFSSCDQEWKEVEPLLVNSRSNATERALNLFKKQLCEKSILQQYLNERVLVNIAVSREEVRNYYLSNRLQFKAPELIQIRQIVLKNEHDARRIRNKTNKRNFPKLAKQYSIAPEAADGGLLPEFTKGEMPHFFNIAFEYKIGQVSPVLKSTYGFHIILLEKKQKTRILSLDEAQEMIEQELLRAKKQKEYQKWVDLALHNIDVRAAKPF